MKKFAITLIAFFLYKNSNSQIRDTGIFDSLPNMDSIQLKKPIVFYTIVSWCSLNQDDFFFISDTLKKYRDNIYLVLLIDTTIKSKTKYKEKVKMLNADNIISLNKYYPTCFYKKKEAKWYATDTNKRFNTNETIMGPSDLYVLEGKKVTFYHPQIHVSSFLDRIKKKPIG